MTAAYGYIRTSTDSQDFSPDAQADAIQAAALARGLELRTIHRDLDTSHSTPIDERPGFAALLSDLAGCPGAAVIIIRRDRLSRDPQLIWSLEAAIQRSRAQLLSCDGSSDDSGPVGELLRGIQDIFARYEVALIRARTRAALAAKKRRRERIGSIPYGYTLNADGCHLDSDPHEQRAIALAVNLRAAGASLRQIACALTAKGFRNRANMPFAPKSIQALLRASRAINHNEEDNPA